LRGIFSPHVIKKIMTGGVSLSHITFLRYQDALRRYRDIVGCDAMRCDVSRLTSRYDRRRDTSRLRRPDKNVDFPPIFRSFYRDARTSRRVANQIRAIATSRLRRNYVTMRHDEISTSRCVATCVVIRKKLKKPNLIIINRVFSRF